MNIDGKLDPIPARRLLDEAHDHLYMVVHYGLDKMDKLDAEHIQVAFTLIKTLRRNQ